MSHLRAAAIATAPACRAFQYVMPVMSRSRPRVVSRCSLVLPARRTETMSAGRDASVLQAAAQTRRRSPSHAALRPALARTAFRCVMRRSELVTVPCFRPGRRGQQHIGKPRSLGCPERLLHDHAFSVGESFRHQGRSGSDCAGLVQAIHKSLISRRFTASNISTAVLPGTGGSESTPHSVATSARCVAFIRLAMSRQQIRQSADFHVHPSHSAVRSVKKVRRPVADPAPLPDAG